MRGCVRETKQKNAYLGESIIARLPDTGNEQSKVTTILRAIGNSKRLRILNELPDGSERSVSELEAIISNLSQSALSRHLSRLRRANIVRTRRESQTIYSSIEDTDVLRILRLLSHIYDHDPVMRPRLHLSRRHSSQRHPPKKTRVGSDVAPTQTDQPR